MRGPVDTVKQWWRAGRTNGNGSESANGNSNGHGNAFVDVKLPQPPVAGAPAPAPAAKKSASWSLLRSRNGNGNGNHTAPEPAWYRQWELNGVPRSLTSPTTTLGRMLDQPADRFADTTAMIYHERQWT